MLTLLAGALTAACVVVLHPAHAHRRTSRAFAATPARQSTGPAVTDPLTVLDLLAVAVEAGAGIPHALDQVGRVVGGDHGETLVRVAAALLLGAPWPTAWAQAPTALRPAAEALAPAWTSGAAAGPALRAAAEDERRHRRRAGREAAGRLGVRLVVPLGLCFLPAFVLIGLVPVLVSLAGALLR